MGQRWSAVHLCSHSYLHPWLHQCQHTDRGRTVLCHGPARAVLQYYNNQTRETGIGLTLILLGIPVYILLVRKGRNRDDSTGEPSQN